MALVLYVYLPGSWNGEESCLTVSRCIGPPSSTEADSTFAVLYQFIYDMKRV